jgi:DsbC/DsbD-like thiol-disulfide interchange protein
MLRASPGQLAIVTLALICLPGVLPARAQDASAWDAEAHAAARLIAGAMVRTPDAAFVRAGIEIRLAPGWDTYWRVPGDSGVPPTFDFAGSGNVKSVTVLWPAPERFPDGAGGHSIGYLGRVILPLRITPEDAARASSVHLKLDYAICGNLCVPAEAKLELKLTGNGAAEAKLERAELLVPRRVALGAGKGLAIRSVHREAEGAHERVVVEVAAPAGAPVTLFVEGPTPDLALPLPQHAGPAGPAGPTAPTRRFTFELDGLPPGAQAKGATLTFTAVSGDDAIEVPAHLD